MQALRRRFPPSHLLTKISSSCSSLRSQRTLTTHGPSLHQTISSNETLPRGTLSAPWSAVQRRGASVNGIDVRVGNVIERKGHIYQVLKSQHTQQGRGGATIQVELRDINTGNKVIDRFRTNEAIEKVFVEDKSYTFLYSEGDTITLMDPDTFEQMDISKELLGKAAAYLKEDMKVTLQMFDGKPMSASIPIRVTCTVAEAQSHMKGLTATPQYKKVLLDNGLTVMAPSFIETGDQIVINTNEDSYITRAKE